VRSASRKTALLVTWSCVRARSLSSVFCPDYCFLLY